jgi:REP element-mobilizing transposase RayT
MARKHRIQYEGAVYHVMNRGDRREPIFKDDQDRENFLEAFGQCCARTGWHVHALCLMPNHFHLVVETPQPNLVTGMKWFLGVYTGRFNRRHKLFGHLFSGRYKSLVVDGSSPGYFRTVCDYVHLNPARAKLLRPEQRLREYRWSSWPEYLKRPKRRWLWLRVRRLLGEYRVPQDSKVGRQYLERCVEEQRAAEDSAAYKPLRRGWCLGDKRFRKELLAEMAGGMGPEHYGEERRETEVEEAERIVRMELRKARWNEEKLGSTVKGHKVKVRVALRLRAETTVSYGWIAERLKMGSRSNVSNLVYAKQKCRK